MVDGGWWMVCSFLPINLGIAFGLFWVNSGFVMAIKNKASAQNGRLGGRPKSLVLHVSPSGGFAWSVGGGEVHPVLLIPFSSAGGAAVCGGRRYAVEVLRGFPAPGVYRVPDRGAAPALVVPASAPGAGWEYGQIDSRNGLAIGRGGRPPGVEVFYKDRSQTQYFNDAEKERYLAEWDALQVRKIREDEIERALQDI
jgi:hypothetical protein